MDALRELWRDPKRRKYLMAGAGAVLVAAIWTLTRGGNAAAASEDPGAVWLPADPIGGGGGGGTGDDGGWLPGDGGDDATAPTAPSDVPASLPALLPENPASPLPAITPVPAPVARLPRKTPPSSVGAVIGAIGAVTPFPGFGRGSPAPGIARRNQAPDRATIIEGAPAPSRTHVITDPAPGKGTNTVVTDGFKVQPGPGNVKGAQAG